MYKNSVNDPVNEYGCISMSLLLSHTHTNKNIKQQNTRSKFRKENEIVLTATELLAAWVPHWSPSVRLPENLQPVGDTQSFSSHI